MGVRSGTGAKSADLARKPGISKAMLYNWKAKYGGMDVSEAKRLSRPRYTDCRDNHICDDSRVVLRVYREQSSRMEIDTDPLIYEL